MRSLYPDHQFIGEESMAEVKQIMHSGKHSGNNDNGDDDYEDEVS